MSLSKPTLDDLRIARSEPPDSKSRFWPVVIALIVVAVAAVAVWGLMRPKAILVRTVLVRGATGASVDRTVLNASGYVTARRAATVSSKVTGKVVEVMVEEGMKVQEGQLLARLDDTNVKAGLQLAEAQLDSARKSLEETRVRIKEAEQELQRIADLIK